MDRRVFSLGAFAAVVAPAARAAAPTQPEVSITYDLGEAGWSSFVLTVGAKTYLVGTFSYTTNALDDLIRAAIDVATGADGAEVRLDGEPIEWRLILDEGWEASMRLRILSFPDSGRPESEGHAEFEARVTADAFARAVQTAAHGIWDRYGEKGYVAAWSGMKGFPLRAMKALDAALATDNPW